MSLNVGEVTALFKTTFDPKGVEQFDLGMKKVIAGATDAENRYRASGDRMSKVSQAMGVAARTAGVAVAGAAVVGVGALAVEVVKATREAAAFEAAMRNVNSIAKLSEGALRGVSDEVLAMAGRTGQAPKVLAEGLYDIASSGFDAKDGLKILEASATAATAGLTDTATSTKAVVAVLNSYGLGAESAGEVSDQLFQIVNQGVLTFPELARQIGDVLPFASSLGIGLDQLGGAIATITKGGTNASATMTQVKGIFNQMLSPSEALQKAIKATGAGSAEALLKHKGLQGGLEDLVGTTDGSKAAIQRMFPDVQALGGVLALTGKKAAGARADLKAMAEASGSTQAAFAEQSKSYEVQAQKFGAAWQAARVTVGEQVLPILTEKLGEWSEGLSAAIESGELEKFGENIAHGAEVALDALEALAKAAPGIARGFASGMDDFLGVITTIDDGVVQMARVFNALPGPDIDLSEIERGVDNINRFRESLREKPPTVKVHVQGDVGDAMSALKRIQGTRVEGKVMKILGQDSSARSKLKALEAIGIPPKTAIMLANIGNALEGIQTVNGALARMDEYKLLTVEVRRVVTGNLGDALKGSNALTPRPRRAAGRGPGNAEEAIVGEGPIAREAVVDPETGHVTIVNGPTIMPIPKAAYVIPQDPRYRGRAFGMLADLAKDLGLEGFAKGKKPTRRATRPTGKAGSSTGTKGAAGDTRAPRTLFGALEPTKLPLDDLQTKRDAAKTALDKASGTVKTTSKAITKKRGQVADIKDRRPKSEKDKANKARDLRQAEQELETLRQRHREAQATQRRQDRAFKVYASELKKAKAFQSQITRQEQLADTAASEMRTADGRNDQRGYDKAKKKRGDALAGLKTLLARARKALADQDSEAARELDKTIAQSDADIQDNNASESGAGSDADRAADEEAEKTADTGMTAAERRRQSGIQRDIALAGLTQPLDDDKAQAQVLVDFLTGVLGEQGARGSGPDVVRDIAEQLGSAKSNLKSLIDGSSTNSDANLQAQLDQERELRRVSDENARINAQALAVFGGSGDIGSGGRNAMQAAAPTVNVYTLHPGDERTLSAIGAAATAGIDNQGFRRSPRRMVG